MFPRVTVQTSKLRLGEGRLTFPARIGGPMMSSCPYSVPLMGIGAVFLRSENVSFFLFLFIFIFIPYQSPLNPYYPAHLQQVTEGFSRSFRAFSSRIS
jgi:hypothetical protein